MCNITVVDQGSVVSPSSLWNITGSLVKKISIPEDETFCSRKNGIKNVFLPISQLTREDAKNLCRKFGEDVGIAGSFEEKEDFDVYYDALQAGLSRKKYCFISIIIVSALPSLSVLSTLSVF